MEIGSETALIICSPWNCLQSATTVSWTPASAGLGCCLPFPSLLGGDSNASGHYRMYHMLGLMWKYRPGIMSQLTDGTVSMPKTLQPQHLTGMPALRAQKRWSLWSCHFEMLLGIWHSHTTPLGSFAVHWPFPSSSSRDILSFGDNSSKRKSYCSAQRVGLEHRIASLKKTSSSYPKWKTWSIFHSFIERKTCKKAGTSLCQWPMGGHGFFHCLRPFDYQEKGWMRWALMNIADSPAWHPTS